MRFCRSCYEVMGEDEEVCHSCGARFQSSLPRSEVSKKTTPVVPVATTEPPVVSAETAPTPSLPTEEQPQVAVPEASEPAEVAAEQLHLTSILNQRTVERVIIPALLIGILAVKLWLSLQYRLALWDGYAYLANAHAFLINRPPNTPNHFFELLRPPFFPFLISLIWQITGENYDVATLIQPTFTVAGAYILFLLMKEMFNLKSAVVGSLLLLAAPVLFDQTNEILVHGVAMFFLTLALFLLWRGIERDERFLPLSAVALALGTLTRYTTVVLVPIFPLMLLVLWMGYRKKRSFPLAGFILMLVAFILTWAPWLYWNYHYEGNPFASMISAFLVGEGTSAGPWYYYILNMTDLITIPGTILLVIGLADMKNLKDRKRLAVLLWLTIFLGFHTWLLNKQERFSIEWTPTLAAFAGLGFSRIEGHLPSKTKIIAWALIGLWLTATFYPLITNSAIGAQNQEGSYGSVEEFLAISHWIVTNTNSSTIGATDIPTALSYQTDRSYYGMGYIVGAAEGRGVTVDSFLSIINAQLVVTSTGNAQALGFTTDPNLTLVKQFPDFNIYLYHCLNCTQSS